MRLHALSIELAHPVTGEHTTLRTKKPAWMCDDAAVIGSGDASR
jgi:hypothetical protein